MIWELSDLPQWDYYHKPIPDPDPLEEIPILRNLLMHAKKPNRRVTAYLKIHNIGKERSMENVDAHLSLALQRLHNIKAATHEIILKDIRYP